jgi:photosystem II stability/assembly factor-like uncharacterized protein
MNFVFIDRMKIAAVAMLWLLTATNPSASQTSQVYVCVFSAGSYVVGAANQQCGLFHQPSTRDTVWQHMGPGIRANGSATPGGDPRSLLITAGNGVHRSLDGGEHWKTITDWRITEAQSIATDPRVPKRIVIASAYGIWRSDDGGDTWAEKNKGFRYPFFASMVSIDAANPDKLFCAAESGAWQSGNAGDSWERMGLSVPGVRCIAQSPHDPSIMFAGTEDNGIYTSSDGGKRWRKCEAGIDHSTFYTIAFDPVDGRTIYAGGYVTGVYKSIDGGESWRMTNSGLPILNIHAIAADPNSPATVYAGTLGGGVYRSDDAGGSWTYAGLYGCQIWSIAVRRQ